MKLNQNLTICSEATLRLPPVPGSVDVFSSLALAATYSTNSIILTFAPEIESSMKVKLYMTDPQSAGKGFVKTEYRLLAVLDSSNLSGLNLYSLYIARWPSGWSAEKKIFAKAIQVNRSTGQSGIERSCFCIVAP